MKRGLSGLGCSLARLRKMLSTDDDHVLYWGHTNEKTPESYNGVRKKQVQGELTMSNLQCVSLISHGKTENSHNRNYFQSMKWWMNCHGTSRYIAEFISFVANSWVNTKAPTVLHKTSIWSIIHFIYAYRNMREYELKIHVFRLKAHTHFYLWMVLN